MDDDNQSSRARALIRSLSSDNPGFIPVISLVELIWVMQSRYDSTKPEIVEILSTLLRAQELVVEDAEATIQALNLFSKSKADFSDCLIERSAHKAGCEYSVTFDRRAAKGAGMRLLN